MSEQIYMIKMLVEQMKYTLDYATAGIWIGFIMIILIFIWSNNKK